MMKEGFYLYKYIRVAKTTLIGSHIGLSIVERLDKIYQEYYMRFSLLYERFL